MPSIENAGFPEIDDWSGVSWIDELTRLRRPLDPLTQSIVHHVLRDAEACCESGSNWIEIGSGDGQLRSWLPERWKNQVLHTEPSTDASERFRQNHPDARLQEASVYELPFEDDSLDGVMGLCVLDALHDQPKAIVELRRVLRPGGMVLHFLDLGLACLESLFEKILSNDQIPFPNYVAEPAMAQSAVVLSSQEESVSLLDDLAICERARVEAARQYLVSLSHELHEPLQQWMACCDASARDASRTFMATTSHAAQRKTWMQQLIDIHFLMAPYPNLSLNPQPASSLRLFQRRLAELFTEESGFQIQQSEILIAQGDSCVADDLPQEAAHFARVVGQVVARRQAQPLEIGQVIVEAANNPGDSSLLVESGVHVLIARSI